MITESRRHKGYVIDLVYNAPKWEAIIYPLRKLARPLEPDFPPISFQNQRESI